MKSKRNLEKRTAKVKEPVDENSSQEPGRNGREECPAGAIEAGGYNEDTNGGSVEKKNVTRQWGAQGVTGLKTMCQIPQKGAGKSKLHPRERFEGSHRGAHKINCAGLKMRALRGRAN